MIHDNVCESQKVNSISFEAEALWFRLLTVVDDNGNYYRDVRRVFPALMLEKKGADEASAERAIKELLKVGLVVKYDADEREYLHIVDFEKYQDLRLDGFACVQFPIHPPELGQGYTKEGRRSSVLRTAEEPKKAVRTQLDSGSRVVPAQCHALEVEVEVKEEGEVEGEVPTTHREGNYNKFREAFKSAIGRATKPKPYPKNVERYQELCRRFGEDEVLDAINAYVALHGKAALYKNKYADSNFLHDEAEDLIKAKLDGTLAPPEEESDEISRVAGPRGVAPELMR